MFYSILIALALGYLLGTIPFGLFLALASGAGDVRKIGSGNIGATNVLRTGKKWAAAATLLCDGAKGAAAVLLARHFMPGTEAFAGLGAVLGHLFPVWLGFKGGKGVATIWRISSLSALIAIALSSAYFLLFGRHAYAALALPLSLLITWMHRENIRRLLSGAEPRIGAK